MGSETPNLQNPAKFMVSKTIWPIGLGLKVDTISPFLGKYRPFVGQPCQTCTPKSMEIFFYKRYTQLGFRNALHITEQDSRFRGWLVRRLSCIVFICDRSADKDVSSDFCQKILKHPSLQSAKDKDLTQDEPVEHAEPTTTRSFVDSNHMEVLEILGQIQRSLSPGLTRMIRWLLVKVLNAMFLNLQLHCGQVATLREASAASPGVPVVFLSTQRSWLDGLIIPFLLFSQNLEVPRVAWESTHCTPFFRTVLQCTGAVFLPQQTGSPTMSDAVLSVYVETFLAEGHSLLIFLESPSTSCPHNLSPIGQRWVQQVIAALKSAAVSDVLIVPVGVSYDFSPVFSSSGGEVVPTSSLGALRSLLWWLLPWSSSLGCARVDFAQPFSLQEYLSSYMWRHLNLPLPLQKTLLPYILGTRSRMQEEEELEGDVCASVSKEQALVDRFILHCLRGAISCSAVMPSHIMAALLLHRYRTGVSFSRLLSDFPALTEEVLLRGFDVGFSGQRWDLVRHSVNLLKRSVSLHSVASHDIYVLCQGSQAAVRQLWHQSVTLLSVYLYEAVGACAVHAILSQVAMLGVVELLFTQDELTEKLLCLCSLLPRTLLLIPPCQSIYTVCQDVLDKLIQCGLLSMHEDPSAPAACDTGRRRFVDRLLWRATDDVTDSDSDGIEENVKRYYKLGRSEHHADSFVFLCHLLCPVLRTYERTALFLQEKTDTVQESEAGYVDRLHLYLLQKAREDGSFECAERSLAVCAVNTFVDLGIFSRHLDGNEPMLQLSETFLIEENCTKLLSFIRQFVYGS
ncbi:glycerol-3-phosphate acyltransferase 2, mitochondrial [Xenopus laevis]|uniref:Glycerol-3-phosphate acyltransferase 2, mitochondrial n=1 Tax=Xenopus laevis TaxID=8355 RepID=A0A8J1MN95_XENLA|nr:glycerol-3-phosphate acyltransferase 2, mitochondrial [Xenopus laevis]